MTGITRRGLMANAAASLGAASLAAPALAQSERTRVLRFIPQIDLVFLDPVFSMTNITRNHAGLVFDRLYSADNALRAHPQMAEGHTIDNDGLRWTIKLRDGLKFHDGEPVLARDAVASLRRLRRHRRNRAANAAATVIDSSDGFSVSRWVVRGMGRPGGAAQIVEARHMPQAPQRLDQLRALAELLAAPPALFILLVSLPVAAVSWFRSLGLGLLK